MKERPILFTPENAQKVFEGVKTQTRRIVKDFGAFHNGVLHCGGKHGLPKALCPYGVVGDRLWIREAFRRVVDKLPPARFGIGYKGQLDQGEFTPLRLAEPDDIDEAEFTPSIHMPRWACRTVVELTEVRVERLQDIQEEDAKAEGVRPGIAGQDDTGPMWTYRTGFVRLWGSINGKDSWALNPWVWVLTFKRVEVGK